LAAIAAATPAGPPPTTTILRAGLMRFAVFALWILLAIPGGEARY
jgi:hypothetical protein